MEGFEAEKEVVCCDCLQKFHVSQARSWKWKYILQMAQNGRTQVRCEDGHLVELPLITGGFRCPAQGLTHDEVAAKIENEDLHLLDFKSAMLTSSNTVLPIKKLIHSVVLVALWDSQTKSMVQVGSGFVVDSKNGLVVTASHTLFEMSKSLIQSDDGAQKKISKFGAIFFGRSEAKILIGVIPDQQTNMGEQVSSSKLSPAVFRYFAEIVEHDVENVDACVLRLKSRLETDIADSQYDFSRVPEFPLKKKCEKYERKICHMRNFKEQNLRPLATTTQTELEEEIRLLGYNQGGEGLYRPGTHLNRGIDFAKGYLVRTFKAEARPQEQYPRARSFFPRQELIVECPTIGGHSGGPCVNSSGEVIGILSRADTVDPRRCYLVPASEFLQLVTKAKESSRDQHLKLFSS
jgi:hypothetical protein